MPDHLLDTLADETPPLRASFADDIIATARRHTRRRWTVAGTVVAAAAIAIGVPVAVDLSRQHGSTVPPAASTTAPGISTSASRATPSDTGTDADVYAAAVRYAVAHPENVTEVTSVLVVDALCASAATGTAASCADTLPADVERAVRAAVPDVEFVDRPPSFTPSYPGDPGRLYVILAPLERDGTSARVWTEQVCGFDCVRGDELAFVLRDGAWVYAESRGGYIS